MFTRRLLIPCLIAAALVEAGGCAGPVAPKQAQQIGVIHLDGSAHLGVNGHAVTLRTANNQPIGSLEVLVGGQVYRSAGDKLSVPQSVLEAATRAGGLVVVVPGYLPGKVALDKDGILDLIPVDPAATYPAGSNTGQPFFTLDGAIGITLPTGAQQATVSVATYTPALTATVQSAHDRERSGMPGGNGPCNQPWPCSPIESSLGIEVTVDGPIDRGTPLTLNYDLDTMLRGWNGTDPAPWVARPDAWSADQRRDATAAASILATFARLASQPAALKALSDSYGLSLAGHTLTFVATPDASPADDGVVVIDVAGSSLLGTRLEVTLVSSLAGSLPGTAALPTPSVPPGADPGLAGGLPSPEPGVRMLTGTGLDGVQVPVTHVGNVTYDEGGNPIPAGATGAGGAPIINDAGALLITDGGASLITDGGAGLFGSDAPKLITEGGGSLITDGGAGVVSNNGAAVIGNNGAGIIANNGGSISGTVRVPFSPDGAKYRLQAYTDYLWPAATVAVVQRPGVANSTVCTTDNVGAYTIKGINGTLPVACVEAKAAGYTLYTFTAAPGAQPATNVGLDATTTLLGAWTLDQVRRRAVRMSEISLTGFAADVQALRPLMSQADAQAAVGSNLPKVAAQAEKLFKTLNFRPRTVSPWTNVTTLAGSPGARGFVDGVGAAARFSGPTGVTIGPDGAIYVFDFFQNIPHYEDIRRVDPAGATTTLSTSGQFVLNPTAAQVPSSRAGLRGAFAPNGTLYYAANDPVVADVRRRLPGGVPQFFVGPPFLGQSSNYADGVGMAARFAIASSLAADASGNLYVADGGNNCIRKVSPSRQVTTFCGGPPAGGAGYQDGPLAQAKLYYPLGVAVDAAGNVYVADTGNYCIRKIDVATHMVSTVAGGPGQPGLVNAPGAAARFGMLLGLRVAADGTVYVVEKDNQRVRMITPDGFVRTLAGCDAGAYADGTGAFATFAHPEDVCLDASGTVYVADTVNNTIRKLQRLP